MWNPLHHLNSRTVAPPGRVRPGELGLPHVVVATCPRAGSHLLIDLILNNFDAYKRRPLYIDLDAGLQVEGFLDQLATNPGYLIKTHLPQAGTGSEIPNSLPPLLWGFPAITMEREEAGGDTFENFWGDHPRRLHLHLEDLTEPEKVGESLIAIASHLGIAPNRDENGTPDTTHPSTLLTKAATRLLGKRSPVVNTTAGSVAQYPEASAQRVESSATKTL